MKHHLPRDHVQYHHLLQPLGNTTRSGQKIFHGLNMMATSKVHFAKYAERLKPGVSFHKEVEVCGSQSLSRIRKKAVQKMKEHASSESHLRQVEAELIVSRGETVVHQLQRFEDSERSKNRKAIKVLLREARTGKPSKYFLAALTTYANSTFLILPTSAS